MIKRVRPIIRRVNHLALFNEDADKEKMILALAGQWFKRLPAGTMYEYGDMINEAFLYDALSAAEWNSDYGVPHKSYSIKFINWNLRNIVNKEWRIIKNKNNNDIIDIEHLVPVTYPDTERIYQSNRIIEKITIDYPEFGDMLTNGVPKELFLITKSTIRNSAFKRGYSSHGSQFLLSPRQIEKYFKINLSSIGGKYYFIEKG